MTEPFDGVNRDAYPKWSDVECEPLTREKLDQAIEAFGEHRPPDRTRFEHPRTVARWVKEGLIVEVEGQPGVYRWKT